MNIYRHTVIAVGANKQKNKCQFADHSFKFKCVSKEENGTWQYYVGDKQLSSGKDSVLEENGRESVMKIFPKPFQEKEVLKGSWELKAGNLVFVNNLLVGGK